MTQLLQDVLDVSRRDPMQAPGCRSQSRRWRMPSLESNASCLACSSRSFREATERRYSLNPPPGLLGTAAVDRLRPIVSIATSM